MTDTLVCWKCGAALEALPLPLARLAECPACRAYLHCCRLCRFYDPRATKACREQDAEDVLDKEHANFCEYFSPRPDAYRATDDRRHASKAQLDALFNGSGGASAEAGTDAARKRLDVLFGDDKDR